MEIYSNKFENAIIWVGEATKGKVLDVDATDGNIETLLETIFVEILHRRGYALPIDWDKIDEGELSQIRQWAWDTVWNDPRLDECYVWEG